MTKRNHIKTFGLDIGSYAVKAVQLQRLGEQYHIATAGYARIADWAHDPAQHQANTISAIRKCVHAANIRTPYAVCAVSGPETLVRSFKFPAMPESEIQQAILLETSQFYSSDLAEAVFDYEYADSQPDGTRVASEMGESSIAACGVVVAAAEKRVQDRLRLVHNAGLQCTLMDADSLAMINCLTHCLDPQPPKSVAFVNIGHLQVTVAILPECGVPFVRDLSYGAHSILDEMAAETGLSQEVVMERLMLRQPQKTEIDECLRMASQQLINDIDETIRYCKALEEDIHAIDAVYLCGGFSLVEGFIALLQNHLTEEVHVFNPLSHLGCDSQGPIHDIISKHGAAFTVAAGLAMRSIQNV